MRGVGLAAHDRDRISEAIRAAEANTCGEIYVVVARAVDDFRFVPVLWAAIAALILPWPLHLLTTLSSTTILLAQAMFFADHACFGWRCGLSRKYSVYQPVFSLSYLPQ